MAIIDHMNLIVTGHVRKGTFCLTLDMQQQKKKGSENEIAEFPQRETDRPEHITPPICWVKIQIGGMSPI